MESHLGRGGAQLIRACRLLLLASAAVPPATGQSRCATPPHRAFDFWAGEWDVFEFSDPGKPVAHARVESILDGCALRERYEGANGLVGESFSIWDAARGVWHQSWVTNRGQLLQLDGGMQGDRMVLTGAQPTPEGKPGLIRGEWYRLPDGVRETAKTSSDGGKTWQPLFDLVFRARKP